MNYTTLSNITISPTFYTFYMFEILVSFQHKVIILTHTKKVKKEREEDSSWKCKMNATIATFMMMMMMMMILTCIASPLHGMFNAFNIMLKCKILIS